MRLVAISLVLVGLGCDVEPVVISPDAGGPGLEARWDPRTCRGNPRARIEIRIVDTAGTTSVADTACAWCSLVIAAPHAGWYAVTAVAVDQDTGGRALAAATLAIDGPGVVWDVPW